MASQDLPAVIEHIINSTGQQQIYYAGHSQGTMIAFAEFSRNQILAKRIKKFFGLAPVAYLGDMESPLKYLADFTPELEVCDKTNLRKLTNKKFKLIVNTN